MLIFQLSCGSLQLGGIRPADIPDMNYEISLPRHLKRRVPAHFGILEA